MSLQFLNMRFSKIPIYCLACFVVIVTLIVVFRLGGNFALRVAQFSPLSGAIIGGLLTLWSAVYPRYRSEQTEPWIGYEQISWILIGSGIIVWGLGESFWRYYISIGQSPFPSIADLGYSSFPPLVFVGLLLQPRLNARSRRTLLLMDSLISTGAILAIAWYLLLGSLAQAPGEASLAKFLGLYYPLADVALLSYVIFLLLRGGGHAEQSRARRVSLQVIMVGLCCFVLSDFLFNILNNLGLFVEGTWIDLGWPLGMVTVGIAAYLRRFLPSTGQQAAHINPQQHAQASLSLVQLLPYGLLGGLLAVLVLNVLSTNSEQVAIRPTLLYATVAVIALVVARQIVTLWDNIRLSQRQAEALKDLESANQQISEQALQIAQQKEDLEHDIAHLALVQAQMANGHLGVRAILKGGVLHPLAGSLNIMAERLMRMRQENDQGLHLKSALQRVLAALEESQQGVPLSIPRSCLAIPEINHLLMLLRFKGILSTFSPDQSRERYIPYKLTSELEMESYIQASAMPLTSLPDTFNLKEHSHSDTLNNRRPARKDRG